MKAAPNPLAAERASDSRQELGVAATLPAPEALVVGPPLPAPGRGGATNMSDEEPGKEREELGEADTWLVPQASMDVPALPKLRLDGLVAEVEQARVFEALFQRAAEPRRLGRYVVLDSLGQGGMGVVLRAYDCELDRAVALKVLHQGFAERHTQRLRREAQALAKLSHPNVVQVYEVGEVEGQTFVAMELVKGKTLREWMEQRPRPGWRACVQVFVQVGAGLAAAHERGLVHRDFKPGNAIIDEKGRPRVLDFGLARWGGEVDDEPSTIQRVRTDADEAVSLKASLTDTGTVLGTPAYMPPEQMDGRQADAGSDQFSFCVSLYEALYGERPFEGHTMEALMVAVRAGKTRPAPKSTSVPESLRKLLLRGLSTDPSERWPSMDALLERLQRLVAPRRGRWLALGVGVGLLGLGGGLGVTQAMEWLSRCTGAQGQLEGVWDEARRKEVRDAILGTGLSYAGGTWERVEPRLDEYAEAWAAEHTETCEATRARNEQSEEEMSLRMGCLRERRQHLRATVNELSRADATVAENAVRAVTSLPGLERCTDMEALRAEVPPPEDPTVAEQVAALGEQLAEAKAKQAAGKYEEGLRLADEVVEKGGTLGYEPLMARAWLEQGELRNSMGDYEEAANALRLAFSAALARRMTGEAASASSSLVIVLGNRLARHEEARGWAEHAEPLSRAAGTDEARAAYHTDLGSLAYSQGKYDEARDHHERALAILEKALGPEQPDVATSLNNLGLVAESQGKYDEARGFHERALDITEKALGPDHPHVATSLANLGNLAYSQGKYDEALDFHKRALANREKALGPDHPHVATSLNNLGAVPYSQGKYDEARGYFDRALILHEKALGPDHPHVAYSLDNLGLVAHAQGKYGEARECFERALTLHEKALGPNHPDVARLLRNLGVVAYQQGKHDEARSFHERELAVNEKALGPDHSSVATSLDNLGTVANSQGRYDEARDFHKRALAIREKALGPHHPDVAVSVNNLGVMAQSQGKQDEARGFHERALAILEEALGPHHPDVAVSLNNLGTVANLQGKHDEARGFYERSLAIREKALGPDHPGVAYPLTGLGKVLLDLAEPADALIPLERALTIHTTQEADPALLAETRFALARALWSAPASQGRDRPRARTLAERARHAYAAAGDASKAERAEVEAWLAKHRLP